MTGSGLAHLLIVDTFIIPNWVTRSKKSPRLRLSYGNEKNNVLECIELRGQQSVWYLGIATNYPFPDDFSLQTLLTKNDQFIQTFFFHGTYEPLCVCIGRGCQIHLVPTMKNSSGPEIVKICLPDGRDINSAVSREADNPA